MRSSILFILALLVHLFAAEEQAILPAGGRQDLPTVQGIVEGPLGSTAFLSGGYDRNTDTLQLTFSNGATYQYFKVNAQVAGGFFQAESKGVYFSKNIRDSGYDYKLVKAAGPLKAVGPLGPYSIVEVSDGDTIKIIIDGIVESVRLMYVDTPETHSNQHDKERPEGHLAKQVVQKWLPNGTSIWLWSPTGKIERDANMRLLAVVLPDKDKEESIQGKLIAEGWSPFWKKYNEGSSKIPDWLAVEFAKFEAEAKGAMRGVWATDPAYMEMVSAETKDSPSRLKTDAPVTAPPAAPTPATTPTNRDKSITGRVRVLALQTLNSAPIQTAMVRFRGQVPDWQAMLAKASTDPSARALSKALGQMASEMSGTGNSSEDKKIWLANNNRWTAMLNASP